MGLYAVQQYRLLQQDFPHLITGVTGTGLLYAVQLNENVFKVVAYDGAEYVLRKQGLGVIHGGTNALRFTPHFRITKDEMDMQVDLVRAFLDRLNNWESLAPRLMLQQSEISRGSPKCSKCVEERGDTSPQYVGADGRVSSRGSNCEHKMCVQIKGHLFDENVINEVLNRVEAHEGTARMLSLKLGTSRDEVSEGKLEVFVPDGKAKLIEELRALVNTTVLVDELGIAGF